MTNKELKRLMVKWQKRLRVVDWEVTIRFGSTDELAHDWAICYPHVHSRSAVILMTHPNDADPHDPDIKDFDIERLIVHELLHLGLAPFRAEGPLEDVEENLAWALSRLLVDLERKVVKTPAKKAAKNSLHSSKNNATILLQTKEGTPDGKA